MACSANVRNGPTADAAAYEARVRPFVLWLLALLDSAQPANISNQIGMTELQYSEYVKLAF